MRRKGIPLCTKQLRYAAWTKIIGGVSSVIGNARRSMFPTWNETTCIEVLTVCAIALTPSLSLGPWRYKEKMATPEQKLQFAKHESVASVLRGFRRQFQSYPPSANSFRHWYQQFQTTGCICKRKSAGRPRALVESVERVRQSEEICAPFESWIGDGDHDCVEGVAKGTGNEALSSSLVAVSSIILVQDVLISLHGLSP
jgi:hypothetical protein